MEAPVNLGQLGAGKPHKLFEDRSAQDFAVYLGPDQLRAIRELAVYVVFGAGVTAGVVVVEGAHDQTFTGTWATLATISWAAESRVHYAALTGCHLWIRVRISTAVAGGTADGYATGN